MEPSAVIRRSANEMRLACERVVAAPVLLLFLLGVAFGLVGCGGSNQGQQEEEGSTLTVLAASSLTDAFGALQRRSKSLTRGRSWKHETYSEHRRQKIVRATEPGFLGHLCVRYIGSTIMTDAVER